MYIKSHLQLRDDSLREGLNAVSADRLIVRICLLATLFKSITRSFGSEFLIKSSLLKLFLLVHPRSYGRTYLKLDTKLLGDFRELVELENADKLDLREETKTCK